MDNVQWRWRREFREGGRGADESRGWCASERRQQEWKRRFTSRRETWCDAPFGNYGTDGKTGGWAEGELKNRTFSFGVTRMEKSRNDYLRWDKLSRHGWKGQYRGGQTFRPWCHVDFLKVDTWAGLEDATKTSGELERSRCEKAADNLQWRHLKEAARRRWRILFIFGSDFNAWKLSLKENLLRISKIFLIKNLLKEMMH